MIEFSHRVAATIVVVLIAVLVLQAFRRLRDRRWLVRGERSRPRGWSSARRRWAA